MRTTILWGGRVAVLSLVIVLIFWYHGELVERFEPIQRLLPTQSMKQDPNDAVNLANCIM